MQPPFSLVYIFLELVAVPAIPLTIAAGALFGPLAGVSLISFSSVVAATISFQIARGVGREWVEKKISEMDDPRWVVARRPPHTSLCLVPCAMCHVPLESMIVMQPAASQAGACGQGGGQ